ncbi:MAG TPA: prolyl oligopeptidase family serine peptidase [Thermoanaerobaculia bacterium]|nr:prolyl oligopeptidase family serine peptidase [Thermoanaerobaculia bacterium]
MTRGVLILSLSLVTTGACSTSSAPPAAPQAPSQTAAPEASSPQPMAPPKISYPQPPRGDVVDDYFGTKIADPFRTLETPDDPATISWSNAQNALTRTYLDRPEREVLKKRITELFNYPRTSSPFRKGPWYFFTHNDGLQNQAPLYVMKGLDGERRLLLDPNTLAADGTAALISYSPSENGALLGYSISRSGSDRQEVYVRDVVTGKDLGDKLEWAKFTDITWTHDGKGFYYERYAVPGTVPAGDEHYFPKLYYHRIGSPQSADRFVLDRASDKEASLTVSTSEDGRYLILVVNRGTAPESEVFVADLHQKIEKFAPLFTGFKNTYTPLEMIGKKMFLQTDAGAPNGKIISVDIDKPGAVTTVVPESKDALSSASLFDRKLVVHYLHNASALLKVFGLDGKEIRAIELPDIGEITDLRGDRDQHDMFFGFQSFLYAPSVYRFDLEANKLSEFEKSGSSFDRSGFETEQVWYPSKDGTKVSMFLVHKRGLEKNGNNPILIYGYGGFDISETPAFSASNIAFIERGGVYALANLRGGSEYGEAWHQAGMLEKKQNVFDDFIAAAEWLIANKYTRRERLAIRGGSNGGLLVAAVEVQRPDLFGAVVCQVPVIDMFRYQRFTLGRLWAVEYGTSEDPQQFAFLLKYSPLHNVKDGVAYPATLITTADTDDRVAPGHAKKFGARMQEAQGGPEPILLRVETKAGHGGGKPTSKIIDEAADIWTFVMWKLGMF